MAEREAEQARDEAERKRRHAEAEAQRLQALADELSAAAKRTEALNPRVLDDEVAKVFENDAQFTAFREAIITVAAQRFIPIDQQLPLAQKMMEEMSHREKGDRKRESPRTCRIELCFSPDRRSLRPPGGQVGRASYTT